MERGAGLEQGEADGILTFTSVCGTKLEYSTVA